MPSMASSMLPEWLRLAWAALLGVVVVVHIGHAVAMSEQRRWWHVGHTIMAAGMALMYLLPGMRYPALHQAGLVLFALLSVGFAAAVVILRRREGILNPLWVASALDLAAMTYMFAPPSSWLVPSTYALVFYLGVQAVAWAVGWWSRVPIVSPVAPLAADAVSAGGGEVVPADDRAEAVGLRATSSPSVRATLAVMAASMAYMLAAM